MVSIGTNRILMVVISQNHEIVEPKGILDIIWPKFLALKMRRVRLRKDESHSRLWAESASDLPGSQARTRALCSVLYSPLLIPKVTAAAFLRASTSYLFYLPF